MDKYSTELLIKSYEQRIKTNESQFDLIMRNGDEFFYYTEAAKYLAENEYIQAISENIFSDNSNPISDYLLSFEILPKGIEYVKQLK